MLLFSLLKLRKIKFYFIQDKEHLFVLLNHRVDEINNGSRFHPSVYAGYAPIENKWRSGRGVSLIIQRLWVRVPMVVKSWQLV